MVSVVMGMNWRYLIGSVDDKLGKLQRNIKRDNSIGRVACFAVLGPSVEGENSLLQAALCLPHMFCRFLLSLPPHPHNE